MFETVTRMITPRASMFFGNVGCELLRDEHLARLGATAGVEEVKMIEFDGRCTVSSAGLAPLQNLPSLEQFIFTNAPYLTDEVLPVLAAMPKLSRIAIARSRISAAQAEKFQAETGKKLILGSEGRLQFVAFTKP